MKRFPCLACEGWGDNQNLWLPGDPIVPSASCPVCGGSGQVVMWPDGVVLAQERYIDRLKRALDERTRRLAAAEQLLLMCDQAIYKREGWEEGPTENEFREKLSGWVVTKETEEQIDAEDEL